jgi:thiamine transport system substrate-binding protein
MSTTRRAALGLVAALTASALAGCAGATSATPTQTPTKLTESTTLTIITHDSFTLTQSLLDAFAKKTGYTLTFVKPGDAGTVVNQLVLTKNSPLGDVVFGIDNTFAGRATSSGVLEPYASAALPATASDLTADTQNMLTPIDYGDVCLNADLGWFKAKNLEVPATLDDLLKPEYKGLLVVENPASSSPGMAFLAATIGAKGEKGYLDYWTALKANGVKVDPGWEEAYSTDFSGSSGKGAFPLVVSYNTSPAYEVTGGVAPTAALPRTCFRQVEYAGVIAGAKNEVGARAFIDFLLSDDVQADIPGQMYMYPANRAVAVPSDWKSYAAAVDSPFAVDPATLSSNRDAWIKAWVAVVVG